MEAPNYISREGGTAIDDETGPVPLFCNRCSVCAGTCPVPEACTLPLPEPKRWSFLQFLRDSF